MQSKSVHDIIRRFSNKPDKILRRDPDMKRIQKSKKGYSLVEMILVIAIIAILASVLIANGLKVYNHIKTVLIGDDTSISSTK